MNIPNLQPPTSNLHLLITGASSGIGAALAQIYAAPNMRLTLHGRSQERLATIAAVAQQRGAEVRKVIANVTDAAAMQAIITEADKTQPLDLVIANAGISGGTSGVEDNREQVARIFATNVNGVLNTIHPVLALMTARKRGQIAIVSSLAGFRGYAGSNAYCASKAAVRVYGEGLRADMAPHGVKVNVICPGFIKTPMTDVNPFKMPFLMTAERAARVIREGLERDCPRIAFPWQTYALVRVMALLPQDFVNRCMGSSFRKPS